MNGRNKLLPLRLVKPRHTPLHSPLKGEFIVGFPPQGGKLKIPLQRRGGALRRGGCPSLCIPYKKKDEIARLQKTLLAMTEW